MDSWLVFRGNEERSGVFAGKLSRELSLFWVIELEPMISSPIFHNNIVYNSTIAGKIFAIDFQIFLGLTFCTHSQTAT